MKRYVCGFMFSPGLMLVALIRKQKPEWQRGFLNGIGGKVEDGESPTQAMVREFEEEAGVKTDSKDWNYFARLSDNNTYAVDFFSSTGDTCVLKSKTNEKIEVLPVIEINNGEHKTLPNLSWIVPMAVESICKLNPEGKIKFSNIETE